MSVFTITNTQKKWPKIATCWVPVKIYRKALRGILGLGIKNYIHVLRHDKKATFTNELSIAAIMKDEGPYLKEWLDFHILAGVDKFYLYDNGSTDNTTEILKPYIERGIVEYKYWPGIKQQNPAYLDALNTHMYDTRWLALIDLDEFIVPVCNRTIPDFLRTLPHNFGALIMSWVMYGSAGHTKKPDGLVIENYKYHANKLRPSGVKSIVNPRLVVRWSNPHANEVAGFLVDENGKHLGRIDQTNNPPSHNKIRCNHYVTKSYEEYMARGTRPGAGAGIAGGAGGHRSPERFLGLDTNDIYDPIMDEWAERVKAFKF